MKEVILIFFWGYLLGYWDYHRIKKQFGPEEGMRGFTFHGKIAVFA
jgi:hypothetical protein